MQLRCVPGLTHALFTYGVRAGGRGGENNVALPHGGLKLRRGGYFCRAREAARREQRINLRRDRRNGRGGLFRVVRVYELHAFELGQGIERRGGKIGRKLTAAADEQRLRVRSGEVFRPYGCRRAGAVRRDAPGVQKRARRAGADVKKHRRAEERR